MKLKTSGLGSFRGFQLGTQPGKSMQISESQSRLWSQALCDGYFSLSSTRYNSSAGKGGNCECPQLVKSARGWCWKAVENDPNKVIHV